MAVQSRPVIRTIAATQARIHFGEVLRRVYRGEEQLIIEKDGLPVAAILSNADYEQYRQLLALQQLDVVNRGVNRALRERGITEEQVLADLAKTKKQVFAEQYGRPKRNRRKAR